MAWISKIDNIVCLNLSHRTDRLIYFTELAEKFQFPFKRISAIRDTESGARGLRDTMLNLFKDEIKKGTRHLLVFEDDCEIIQPPAIFHDVMDKATEQMPESYHMIFLGCQLTTRVRCKFSPNLLPVIKAFSTHSVLYSLHGMKEIVSRGFGYPIDNWYVDEIQPLGHSYCTYPLLTSQISGYSDIGHNDINWGPFIIPRYAEQTANL